MELDVRVKVRAWGRLFKPVLSISNHFCFVSHSFKVYYISESECQVFADKSASYDRFNLQAFKAIRSRFMVQHTLCSQFHRATASSGQLTCSGVCKIFISDVFALLLQTIPTFSFYCILLGFVYSSTPLLFHLHCPS